MNDLFRVAAMGAMQADELAAIALRADGGGIARGYPDVRAMVRTSRRPAPRGTIVRVTDSREEEAA